MNKTYLLSTAALSLLLSAGAANAQGMQEHAQGSQQHIQQQMPDRAPAAQQNAPAEKSGPSLRGGEHQGSPTTGQGGREFNAQQHKPGDNNRAGSRAEELQQKGLNKNERSTSGSGTQNNVRENAKERATEQHPGLREGQQERNQSVRERETTTGQGAAGRAARLTPEQRTRITTIIRERNIQPVQLNVPVRVGVRVPRTVHFYPLPPRVIEVYPEWRGYDYILVAGQILIVDPNTHEIVAILEA